MNSFFQKFDLPILISLILLPLICITVLPIYIYFNGIIWQEILMLVFGWFLAGMGITIGYHRYFSHRSFKTHSIVEWFLMFFGDF